MLDGYIPLLIVLVLLIAGMIGLFSVLPSLSEGRYKRTKGVSLKVDDIVSSMVREKGPEVKDGAYLETYESGEVARGDIGKFVTVQYFVIILLFVVFDIAIPSQSYHQRLLRLRIEVRAIWYLLYCLLQYLY